MKDINYLEIMKKSWKITWHNRYLWWFGLFLALGGGGGFNFNFPGGSNWNKSDSKGSEVFNNFIIQHKEIILAGVSFFVILVLALVVLKIIAQAGLIKTLSGIEKGEARSFKKGFQEGKKYFWKLLGASFILGFFIFGIFVILFTPVAFLFFIKSFVFGAIALFLAILILIPLIILISFLGKYAFFYIILSEMKIKSSLELGYQLFCKNIFPSIIMALFFIPISLVLIFAVLAGLLTTAIMLLLPGIIFYVILAKTGLWILLILGAIIAFAFLLLVSSVYQVFYQTTWFLFFKEIASVKEEEEIKEVEKEIIPSPEGA